MTVAETTEVVPVETAVTPVVPAGDTAKPEGAEAAKPVERTFTQAEMDAAIEKRLAREKRQRDVLIEAEVRRLSAAQKPQAVETQASDPAAPKRDDFDTYEDYIRADARFVAKQELKSERESERKAQQEAKQRQDRDATISVYAEREAKAKEKYADFDDVVRDPSLTITGAMFEALVLSDDGPELAYWLGHNRAEAQRIAQLPPIAQAKEIGKLELKLAAPASPKPAPVSKAPEPIDPVGGARATPVSGKPPADPDEYRRWRTAQREAEARGARA